MQVERIEVSRLTGDPANARKHGERNIRTIVESLSRFGQQKPIVVDSSFCVRAGNGTLEAARSLGWTHLDCVVTDLKGSDAIAYAIADNRTAELAEWDSGVLAATLEGLQFDDEALLAAAGFSEDELAELLKGIGAELDVEGGGGVTEDEVPEPPIDPITKPGDLWGLGRHRLLCGDSTKADDVGRLMGGAKADLLFTSPPYGAGNVAKLRDHYVKGDAKRESFYDNHDDAPEKWLTLMNGWWAAFRPYADLLIVNVQLLADNKRDLLLWAAERRDELVDVVVWDKGHAAPQMQANVLSNCFEFVYLFGGNGSRSIPFANFHGTMQNVIRVNPKGANENPDKHRAVMPIALPLWAIAELCKRAESVVEPFCGTGTTLIAAEQLNRKCFAMELSPNYCDVIIKRWENLTGQKAVLDDTRDTNDVESNTAAVADQTGVSGRDNKATNSNRRKPKKQPA